MTAAYPGKSDGSRACLLTEASSVSSAHCTDASTSVLDVDDRNAPDAHAAQRNLSGDQHLAGYDTGSSVAHIGRQQLGRGDASIGDGLADRLGGVRFETAVNVLAEMGQPVPTTKTAAWKVPRA